MTEFTVSNPGEATGALQQATNALFASEWNQSADDLRTNAEAAYNRLRNNPGLTPDARRSLMAEVYINLQEQMDGLREASGAGSQVDIAAYKRRLFGIDDLLEQASPAERATVAISFRDAQDRAAKLTRESEAADLLDTAEATGDELLARAIGNAALTGPFGNFGEVGSRYLENRPDKAEAYRQLQNLPRLSAAKLFEYIVPMPPELSSVFPSTIPQLAAQAPEIRAQLGSAASL